MNSLYVHTILHQLLFRSNKISSKFHTYDVTFFMPCKSGSTSCRLPGGFIYEGWYFGVVEVGYEFIAVYGVDTKFVECRSDEDFILYDGYECWVELVMRHVEFLFWEFRWTGKGFWTYPVVSLLTILWVWKEIRPNPSTNNHIFDFEP